MLNGNKLYSVAFSALLDMYKQGEAKLVECYDEVCKWFLQGSIDRILAAKMLRELSDLATDSQDFYRYEGRINRKIHMLEN